MENYLNLFYILYIVIFFFLILINNIECYYVLPLKTTYDYNKETEEITEIMHNFLSNNLYT